MAPHSSMLAIKSQEQRNLVGYSPWGRKKSDMTEATEHTLTHTHKYILNSTYLNMILYTYGHF